MRKRKTTYRSSPEPPARTKAEQARIDNAIRQFITARKAAPLKGGVSRSDGFLDWLAIGKETR